MKWQSWYQTQFCKISKPVLPAPKHAITKALPTYNFEIQFNLKFCLSSYMHLVPDETCS